MTMISVIIPTYNRLWSLEETVRSCRASRYPTQVIVVDDGSTDGTWDWLCEQDDIISFKQQNMGKCWAVNAALKLATGEYVRFLDSDDLLSPNDSDEQAALARSAGCDVCVSGYKTINLHGDITGERTWISCTDFIAQQLGECDSSHYSAYLFRREFIADIPHRPDFAFRDDRLFVLEVALKEPAVCIYGGYSLLHRQHSLSRLQNRDGIELQVQHYQQFMLYKKIVKQLNETGRLSQRRVSAAVTVLWPLAHWVAKYNIRQAIVIRDFILQLCPGFKIGANGPTVTGIFYRVLGFRATHRILNIYRFFRYGS